MAANNNNNNNDDDSFIHRLDGSLRKNVWSYLSWIERHRAATVNASWKAWHAGVAYKMVEEDWQALCHRSDTKRHARIQARAALKGHDDDKERLDLLLYDAVNWMLISLGSEEVARCRHPPQSTLHKESQVSPVTIPLHQQIKRIQELLDAGASDTHFFAEGNQYGHHASNLDDLFDTATFADGPSRVDHYITMLKPRRARHEQTEKGQRRNDQYAWELVQEMGYSACEKWKLSGTSEGFQRFHCLLLNHVLVPYCRMDDRYASYRDYWQHPNTLESRETVFQTLCLVFRECPDMKKQWYFLPDTISDLIEHTHEAEDLSSWTEPHVRFRHRFFLHLFRRLVLVPEIRRVGTSSADRSSWLLDLMNYFSQYRNNKTPVHLFCLVNLQNDLHEEGDDNDDNVALSFLRLLNWEAICQKFMGTKSLHRQFRHKLQTNRPIRLVAMEKAWQFFIRSKDRKVLLDIFMRLEPLHAKPLLPEWIAMVQAPVVKGKKERLLKELLEIQETLKTKEHIWQQMTKLSYK